MTPQTIRILIAGGLFVHGVGHTLGFFKPARSWILPALGEPALRIAANILWSLAVVGFILSCLAFLGVLIPAQWWRPLAVIFSFVSLLGLLLFLGNWPIFNTIGAIGFNIVVLVALLWLHWPPIDMFGR
jgi:hypothetical protein